MAAQDWANRRDLFDDDLPITPYRGTGGSVPRDTSVARADKEVKSGNLGDRQMKVLRILFRVSTTGATWSELGDELGLHHGQISGVLSNLHKEGRVFMLKETRLGSHPYCHVGIRGHFQADQIYEAPVKTSLTTYREAFNDVAGAAQACIDSGFSQRECEALIELLRDNAHLLND
jgi:hypothetical protein